MKLKWNSKTSTFVSKNNTYLVEGYGREYWMSLPEVRALINNRQICNAYINNPICE